MAKPLQPLTISAPGFLGINTEESSIGMNPAFASVADNCVIDKKGRIAARKGYTAVSTNGSSVLGSSRGIEAVFEYTSFAGAKVVFSAGNNKIFHGTTTLTECSLPVGYTISANNWKITSFNNDVYFFQSGHTPLRSAAGSTTLTEVSGAPQANEVLSAFGRLWAADIVGDKHTVHVTSLLDGTQWSGGTSFSINITQFWPEGYDEIVSLTEHNGLLIIFGKHSMLIYDGAQGGAGSSSTGTPASADATIFLKDTIEGVGCIERDSVQATGNDILFLSNRGLMSLGRVIQEKSLPLRDVSKNVRTDLMQAVLATTTNPVKSVYSADDAFYLLTIPDSNITYVFDVRTPMQDGSFRATTWSGIMPLSFTDLTDDGFYMGLSTGIVKYGGYQDGSDTYQLRYFSNPLDFQSPGIIKFLKKINLIVEGGANAQATLHWAYDYTEDYRTQTFTFQADNAGEYGIAQFGSKETTPDYPGGNPPDPEFIESEYSGGVNLNRPKTNATGSGAVISMGVTSTINNNPFAIQKIDLMVITGRLI